MKKLKLKKIKKAVAFAGAITLTAILNSSCGGGGSGPTSTAVPERSYHYETVYESGQEPTFSPNGSKIATSEGVVYLDGSKKIKEITLGYSLRWADEDSILSNRYVQGSVGAWGYVLAKTDINKDSVIATNIDAICGQLSELCFDFNENLLISAAWNYQDPKSYYNLVMINTDDLTADPVKLFDFPAEHPDISPDGKKVLFSKMGKTGLYNIEYDSFEFLAGLGSYAKWSPQGDRISAKKYFTEKGFCIYTIDSDGTNEKEHICGIPDMGGGHWIYDTYRWSPDGSMLGVSLEDSFQIADLNNNSRIEIKINEIPELGYTNIDGKFTHRHLSFSPTSDQIVFVVEFVPNGSNPEDQLPDSFLYIVDINNGALENLKNLSIEYKWNETERVNNKDEH